jgi:hypothetical protein
MLKLCGFLFVSIFFGIIEGQAQSIQDNVHLLDCNTWGTADWHLADSVQRATGVRRFGDVVRIVWDDNIEPLLPNREVMYNYFNDEIYFRWLLKDTSIYYDIRIATDQEEVLFETNSNDCGVKVGLKNVARLVQSDLLIIYVQRAGTHPNGLRFGMRPLPADESQKISDFLKNETVKKRRTTRQRLLETADYFYLHNMNLDALSYLEYAIEMDPDDPEIKKKYWKLLNQMAVRRN